jgi:hypothetical protein
MIRARLKKWKRVRKRVMGRKNWMMITSLELVGGNFCVF